MQFQDFYSWFVHWYILPLCKHTTMESLGIGMTHWKLSLKLSGSHWDGVCKEGMHPTTYPKQPSPWSSSWDSVLCRMKKCSSDTRRCSQACHNVSIDAHSQMLLHSYADTGTKSSSQVEVLLVCSYRECRASIQALLLHCMTAGNPFCTLSVFSKRY